MNPPDVSIVITTYNRLAFLRQSLASALAQRDIRFEVVVVDNGSDDGTSHTVQALRDPRVRLVRHSVGIHPTEARRTGVEIARGRWVGFLDDDDLWAPDNTAAQIAAGESTGRSWVYTGIVEVDAALRVRRGVPPLPPERVMEELPRRCGIWGGVSGVIMRHDLITRAGQLDGRLRHLCDWELWLRYAQDGPPAYVPRPNVAIRQHGGNLSMRAAEALAELDALARLQPAVDPLAVDRRGMIRNHATLCALAGQRRQAAGLYRLGVREGDREAALVALTLLLPRRLQTALRRHRADKDWLAQAEAWLADLRNGD